MTQVFDLDPVPAAAAAAAETISQGIRKNEDGTITLTLVEPVETVTRAQGGPETTTQISQLTFRKPRGGDLRAMASLSGDAGVVLAAIFTRLSAQPVAVFDKLCIEDAAAVQGILNDFLEPFQRIGRAS